MDKMKFHITIKDNETGEVLKETDTNAIIGAFNMPDNTTASCVITECNTIDLLKTMKGCLQAVQKIKERNPALAMLEALSQIGKDKLNKDSEKKEYN